MIIVREQLRPREFLTRSTSGQVVTLVVDAETPVNVYVVDSRNLDRYRKGGEFEHFGPGSVRSFSSILRLPRSGAWHAIIENPLRTPTWIRESFT